MNTGVKQISTQVKQILSDLNWDFTNGTVRSNDLLTILKEDKTISLLVKVNALDSVISIDISVDTLIEVSLNEAKGFNSNILEVLHLFVGFLKIINSPQYLPVKEQVIQLLGLAEKPYKQSVSTKNNRTKSKKPVGAPSDFNSFFIKDLTKLAVTGKLKPVVGNKKLEDRILSMLHRKYKNSLLLVGTKGSGKTSLIMSLAHRVSRGDVPEKLKNASFISVNLAGLVHSGDLREKLDNSIKEHLQKSANQNRFTIFFFDDLHLISSIGLFGFSPPVQDDFVSDKNSNLGTFSNVAFIAAINEEHSERVFEGPILELWEPFKLPNPSDKHTLKILEYKANELQSHFNLRLTKRAIKDILNLVNSTDLNLKGFSDSSSSRLYQAVTIMDDIFATFYAKYNLETKRPKNYRNKSKMPSFEVDEYNKDSKVSTNMHSITIPDIFVLKHLKTFYPSFSIDPNLSVKNLKTLDQNISKNIVGQKEAINALVKTIKRSVLGLGSKTKPMSSILFLGPTGVGKTETAKQLARYLYGKKSLIRIDMSDFMEKHTVARLVGSPPGYVGYGEGGQLTNFVAENPNCVVLFDEIEKAHTDVLNILLQILEEGQLTSGEGELVSFKKAVVILTSNIGTENLNKLPIGFINKDFNIENQKVKDTLIASLKEKIKPEILNRLNDIVVFNTLTTSDARKIIKLNIHQLQNQVYKEHGIKLQVSSPVINLLLKKGYSKEYGAREIKRSVESNLVDVVIDTLLKSKKPPKTLHATKKGKEVVVE